MGATQKRAPFLLHQILRHVGASHGEAKLSQKPANSSTSGIALQHGAPAAEAPFPGLLGLEGRGVAVAAVAGRRGSEPGQRLSPSSGHERVAGASCPRPDILHLSAAPSAARGAGNDRQPSAWPAARPWDADKSRATASSRRDTGGAAGGSVAGADGQYVVQLLREFRDAVRLRDRRRADSLAGEYARAGGWPYEWMYSARIALCNAARRRQSATYAAVNWDARVARAWQLFDELRELGLAPTEYAYSAMVNIMAKAGRPLDAERVVGLMEAAAPPPPPSLVVYNNLADAWAAVGDMEATMSVRDRLSAAGLSPNLMTFNILIKACAKAGRPAAAAALLGELRAGGLTPNIFTFNSLIDAHARAGDADAAVGVWAAMKAEGVPPDPVTRSCLMTAFRHSPQPPIELWNELSGAGTVPPRNAVRPGERTMEHRPPWPATMPRGHSPLEAAPRLPLVSLDSVAGEYAAPGLSQAVGTNGGAVGGGASSPEPQATGQVATPEAAMAAADEVPASGAYAALRRLFGCEGRDAAPGPMKAPPMAGGEGRGGGPHAGSSAHYHISPRPERGRPSALLHGGYRRVDLHGLSAAESRVVVAEHLSSCVQRLTSRAPPAGLVFITGQGRGSGSGESVLQTAVVGQLTGLGVEYVLQASNRGRIMVRPDALAAFSARTQERRIIVEWAQRAAGRYTLVAAALGVAASLPFMLKSASL